MFGLGQRKKLILLRSAAHRGAGAFLHQAWATVADIGLRRRNLVFQLDGDDFLKNQPADDPTLEVRRVSGWHDLPETLRRRLESGEENLEWGDKSWFDKDRWLWAATFDGEVCCLAWILGPDEDEHFFCAVPSDAEILFQIVVLPEFRGRSLQVRVHRTMMAERLQAGTRRFFIACHEYNYTSRRNIEKLGFRLIGFHNESRFTSRQSWQPLTR
ncbi:GNAT family N-acetyltransferase [Ruegeria atlantica]|uniref:GNAT family N-acetyltransferase n=1 Tax=Ruegeria atlantica TaxID=81569 RepID=UPI0014810716